MGYYTDALPPERGSRRAPKRYGGMGGGGFGGAGASGSWNPDPRPPAPRGAPLPTMAPPHRNANAGMPVTNGWVKVADYGDVFCNCTGTDVSAGVRRYYHFYSARLTPNSTCAGGGQIVGGQDRANGAAIAVPANSCTMVYRNHRDCSVNDRYTDARWFHRAPITAPCVTPAETIYSQASFIPVPSGIPLVGPSLGPLDPNVMRRMPGTVPFVPPIPPPALGPGGYPWAKGYGPEGGRYAEPAGKNPPRGRNKERKFKSRIARFGIFFFSVLDKISESAEIVDAFYDSLPKDVRKRWEKGRPNRSFLDNAGQYGIDGADWKAQAIYENFGKIDATEALKNIVKNHIEDKVIGAYSRYLPRNTVNALNFLDASGQRMSHEAIIAAKMKIIFEAIGLE